MHGDIAVPLAGEDGPRAGGSGVRRPLPGCPQAPEGRISSLEAEGGDRTYLAPQYPPRAYTRKLPSREQDKSLRLFKDLPKLVVAWSLGPPLPSPGLRLVDAVNC